VRTARIAGALALALAADAPRARAQEFLDRGTFVIERGGNEVGREDFAIRRSTGRGTAGGILAVATVHYRDRDLRPALELSGDLTPISYQVDVSAGGRVVERFSAQFARGRIAARLATQQREVLQEFPVPAAVAVLDDDAFHQYYFLPRAAAGGSRIVRLLRPRGPALADGEVRRIGPDTVTVGSRTLSADRYVLRIGDSDERYFWFTADGDLLRVAEPAREVVATRTSPPPH
jgi:hypothetical protein